MVVFYSVSKDPAISLAMHTKHKEKKVDDSTNVTEIELMTEEKVNLEAVQTENIESDSDESVDSKTVTDTVELKIRKRKKESSKVVLEYKIENKDEKEKQRRAEKYKSWKRMILLIVAITVHNIPGK